MHRNNTFLNWIWTAVLLMALWFIMSEKTEPKFLIIGAVSSMIIAAVCIRTMTTSRIRSGTAYYMLGFSPVRFIIYFLWLMVQIIMSAVHVSRISLADKSRLQPQIVWFRADYDSPTARSVLANSITLTPGTVTIDITDDGVFSVHALTDELGDGLLDGSMQTKVAWLFGEVIDYAPINALRSEAFGTGLAESQDRSGDISEDIIAGTAADDVSDDSSADIAADNANDQANGRRDVL